MSARRQETKAPESEGHPSRAHLAAGFVLGMVDVTIVMLELLGIVDISGRGLCVLLLAHLATLSPFYKVAKLAGLIELTNSVERELGEARKELADIHNAVRLALHQNASQSQSIVVQPAGGGVEELAPEEAMVAESLRDTE